MIISGTIYKFTATSEDMGPIVWHRGILFQYRGKEYIIHRTFGGVEIIPFEVFIAHRHEVKREAYELKNPVDVEEVVYQTTYDEFEPINNNCENFVNDFIDTYTTCRCARVSQQVLMWVGIIMVILIAYKLSK